MQRDFAHWQVRPPTNGSLTRRSSGLTPLSFERWTMKIDEFNTCVSDYQKKSLFVILASCGCFLLAVVVGSFYHKIEMLVADMRNAFWAAIIPLLPMLAFVIAGCSILIPMSRRVERTAGCHCQHCSKQIASSARVVIASKHCPHCGRRVIEEEGLTPS